MQAVNILIDLIINLMQYQNSKQEMENSFPEVHVACLLFCPTNAEADKNTTWNRSSHSLPVDVCAKRVTVVLRYNCKNGTDVRMYSPLLPFIKWSFFYAYQH